MPDVRAFQIRKTSRKYKRRLRTAFSGRQAGVENAIMCSLLYAVTETVLDVFAHVYFPASGQAMVTGVVPFPPVHAFNFYRA